jgi:two-component system, chemotaxis family, protein-glutamate methylesterase/glutaminase
MERVVVVGASAGGVSALEKLASGLAADFPAPILIVLHLAANHKSLLAEILSRAGPLSACNARDGMAMAAGEIYIAAPDCHLLVDRDRVMVRKGPRENGFRPSVDVLFRSAAHAWGSHAIGVVLSGALDDGASGLWAIKELGGIAVVQDPADAAFDSMPVHALRRASVDYKVPAANIGALLGDLVRRPAPAQAVGAEKLREELKAEIDISAGDSPMSKHIVDRKPTPYTCPSCHGVMFEVREGSRRRFRCHTGHGYTAESLLTKLMETTEDRLWDATRAVEEAVFLLREAARDLQQTGMDRAAHELVAKAQRATRELELLRSLSMNKGGLVSDETG